MTVLVTMRLKLQSGCTSRDTLLISQISGWHRMYRWPELRVCKNNLRWFENICLAIAVAVVDEGKSQSSAVISLSKLVTGVHKPGIDFTFTGIPCLANAANTLWMARARRVFISPEIKSFVVWTGLLTAMSAENKGAMLTRIFSVCTGC